MKNWAKAIESDLNQVKKAGTVLLRVKEGNSCPKYTDRNPVQSVKRLTNML